MTRLATIVGKSEGPGDCLGTYESDFADLWRDFVRYVVSTQISSDTKKNLEDRFYDDPQIKKHLAEIEAKRRNVSDVLNDCIRELKGAYVARDDHNTYSVVSRKQLPKVNLPSGGDYDIPLCDFLIKKGASRYQAIRTYNALKSYIFSKDARVLINVGGTIAAVLEGDSSSNRNVLTVGGTKEFIDTYGLHLVRIHGLGEKGYDILISSLNSIK